jgi:2-iminobutanoate/2-iminopropanoate deaminase
VRIGVVSESAPITHALFGIVPAIGHYSHATELPNGIIYLSGQKAWHPDTGELVVGNVAAQVHRIFDNLSAILASIGLDQSALTRISCYLADVDADYEAFNQAYAVRLGMHKPARTVIGGCALRGGALVELVAEAYRKPG